MLNTPGAKHPFQSEVGSGDVPRNFQAYVVQRPTRWWSLLRCWAEHVFDMPSARLLNKGCIPQDSRGHKHFMGRLEDALQVGGETLHERQLLGEPIDGDAPLWTYLWPNGLE